MFVVLHKGWIAQSCLPASAPTWQRCDNIGANIVSTSVPNIVVVVICRCFYTCQHSCVEVSTMLFEYCILPKITTLPHCCHNVGRHWLKLRQCSGNIVGTLWQHCFPNIVEQCWDNIQAICEHCDNVTPQRWDRHWDNGQATLCEHCLNVGA